MENHNSLKKIPLSQLALSECAPDLYIPCKPLSEPRTNQQWPNRPFCPSSPRPLGPKCPKYVQFGIKHLWALSGVLCQYPLLRHGPGVHVGYAAALLLKNLSTSSVAPAGWTFRSPVTSHQEKDHAAVAPG